MRRASVDLPHPLSPTRPRVSPPFNERLTPSTARTYSSFRRPKVCDPTGKYLVTSSTSSRTSVADACATGEAVMKRSPECRRRLGHADPRGRERARRDVSRSVAHRLQGRRLNVAFAMDLRAARRKGALVDPLHERGGISDDGMKPLG